MVLILAEATFIIYFQFFYKNLHRPIKPNNNKDMIELSEKIKDINNKIKNLDLDILESEKRFKNKIMFYINSLMMSIK